MKITTTITYILEKDSYGDKSSIICVYYKCYISIELTFLKELMLNSRSPTVSLSLNEFDGSFLTFLAFSLLVMAFATMQIFKKE